MPQAAILNPLLQKLVRDSGPFKRTEMLDANRKLDFEKEAMRNSRKRKNLDEIISGACRGVRDGSPQNTKQSKKNDGIACP